MTNIVKYDYGKLDKVVKFQQSITKVKSVDQMLEVRKETPTLVTMKLDLGIEKASSFIELLILKLNQFMNVKEKMSKEQIQETALLILEEYYFLTFSEVLFVLKEAKLGRYGELYNSIDGTKILKWFASYNKDRMDAVEKKNENERLASKFADERISTKKDNAIRLGVLMEKTKRNASK